MQGFGSRLGKKFGQRGHCLLVTPIDKKTLGGQTLEPGAMPDRKEGYYIGVELPESDPRVAAGRFNRGPNIWPADLPGFQPTMRAYFAALSGLGETLMRGIALSLDLPEDSFDGYCHDPLATLRARGYLVGIVGAGISGLLCAQRLLSGSVDGSNGHESVPSALRSLLQAARAQLDRQVEVRMRQAASRSASGSGTRRSALAWRPTPRARSCRVDGEDAGTTVGGVQDNCSAVCGGWEVGVAPDL